MPHKTTPAPPRKPQSPLHAPLLGFSADFVAELRRSQTADTALHADRQVQDWVDERLSHPCLHADIIPLHDLRRWGIDPTTGDIQHESGMFFSITGVTVRHRTASKVLNWDQPIIDQPEVGILGILAKRIDGVLHFCLQAKEEPGNINSIQLSPTVQATYSNYTRVHGGSSPPFLDHFLSPASHRILLAKLQTEDGGRFLFKSNRNMIILADDDDTNALPPTFIWLTLRQIGQLIRSANLIHACTRSILAALISTADPSPDGSATDAGDLADLVQWLDDQKAANHILVKRTGLNSLTEWHLDPQGYFSHEEQRFFRVIGIAASSTGREVASWTQPILINPQQGIIGLLTRHQDGERQYLLQAKAEVGNRSLVQLAPTVQFTPGNYIGNPRLVKPFLFDTFALSHRFTVLHESSQSEEGARFFRESHRHRILELPVGTQLDLPPEFRWVTESQLRFFLHLGEQVNSCARSVISCLIGATSA
jgi:oxidase EvaA